MASTQQNNDQPNTGNPHDQAEPASDLWRCESCGANTKLHYRRRDPGNCANCGARAWVPWHRRSPPTHQGS